MRWDHAGGYVAVTPRGAFLIGTRSERHPAFGGYWAVDLTSWQEADDLHKDHVAEWFSRWRVVVEETRDPFVLSFDAKKKEAAKAA
jgi:hypothetical protein